MESLAFNPPQKDSLALLDAALADNGSTQDQSHSDPVRYTQEGPGELLDSEHSCIGCIRDSSSNFEIQIRQ